MTLRELLAAVDRAETVAAKLILFRPMRQALAQLQARATGAEVRAKARDLARVLRAIEGAAPKEPSPDDVKMYYHYLTRLAVALAELEKDTITIEVDTPLSLEIKS